MYTTNIIGILRQRKHRSYHDIKSLESHMAPHLTRNEPILMHVYNHDIITMSCTVQRATYVSLSKKEKGNQFSTLQQRFALVKAFVDAHSGRKCPGNWSAAVMAPRKKWQLKLQKPLLQVHFGTESKGSGFSNALQSCARQTQMPQTLTSMISALPQNLCF